VTAPAVPAPVPVRPLVPAVVGAGVAAAAGWLTALSGWSANDALAFLLLLVATTVSERFPLELLYRSERAVYTLSDAIWTAALLLAAPSVVALAVAGGVLAGEALVRRPPQKVAFNTAQLLIGMTAALGVFALLGSPPADEPAGWAAAALAMGTFHAVNTVLVGAALAHAEGRPIREMLLAATGLSHWVGNIAAGALAALVWTAEPLGLPLLLIPLALTFLAYRSWLRTVQERDGMAQMGRAADSIVTSGDLSNRISETAEGEDAVGQLAATLNRMLARLETSFKRERDFIRETSHELRTPITICRGHLDVLSPEPSVEELAETNAIVFDELDRMARIVEDMCDIAFMEDPSSLRRRELKLEQFVAEVSAKAMPLVDGRLRVEAEEARGPVLADGQRLTQALINLLKNAGQHTPADTPIELSVRGLNGSWRFEVADAGGGLTEELETRAFQPFFKGEQSDGCGLGLAIVAGIAKAHGGAAGLDNRRGEGATFWLEIPR
jgi:signal transduction histidine kinase